jgi:large subunit ribosomal protein L29
MKAKELHDNTVADLKAEETRLRKELFDLQFKHGTRQLMDTAAISRTRRQLARVLTVISQKTREQAAG